MWHPALSMYTGKLERNDNSSFLLSISPLSVYFNWPGGLSTQKWLIHDPIRYVEVEKSAIKYGKVVFHMYFTLNI